MNYLENTYFLNLFGVKIKFKESDIHFDSTSCLGELEYKVLLMFKTFNK